MTVYIEPRELFERVATMRTESTPASDGTLSAPTTGVGDADEALALLASRVAALPSDIASQLAAVGNAFVAAAVDAIAADQFREPDNNDGPGHSYRRDGELEGTPWAD